MPLRRIAALAVVLGAAAAAPAWGATATPLVRRAPETTAFRDRIVRAAPSSSRGQALARAAAADAIAVPTREGYAVQVSFSPSYGVQPDVAAGYVGFLDSLPHGSELRLLRVRIMTPDEVGAACGGGPDVLACYSPATREMTVPGGEVSTAGSPSTAYVVAHEYGHHLAFSRDNAPFSALDFGPKRWSSEERVCARTLDRLLAPGDEGAGYIANPGENWAETYARLTFPDVPWTFSQLLRPTPASLAAARRDVFQPWTGPRTAAFAMPAHARDRTFHVRLTLDGSLQARLVGPRGSAVGVSIRAAGRREGHIAVRGSRHTVGFEAACRTRPSERVAFHVRRRGATGRVTLRVRYAG